MEKIPFEIWESIFNYLQSKKDQYQCQIVCKAWYSSANQVFYQTIHLHSIVSLNRFINHLYTYSFGKNTRKLFLYMDESPYTSSTTITLSNLEALIQLCPNIEQLFLPSKSTVWKLLLQTNLSWDRLRILSELSPPTLITSRDQNQLGAYYKYRKSLYQLHFHENPKFQLNMNWQSYLFDFNCNIKTLGIHSMLIQNVNTILPVLQRYIRLSHLHLVLHEQGAWQQTNKQSNLNSLVLDLRGDAFEPNNIGCIIQQYPNIKNLKLCISKPIINWLNEEKSAINTIHTFLETVSLFRITTEILGVESQRIPPPFSPSLIAQHFLITKEQLIQRNITFCFFYPSSLESTLYIPKHKKNMDITLTGKEQRGVISRSAIFRHSAYVVKGDQWISAVDYILHAIANTITTLVLQLNFGSSFYYFQSFKDMRLHRIISQFPKLESIAIYQAKANQIIQSTYPNPAFRVNALLLWKVQSISRHLLFNLSRYFPSLTRLTLRSCHFYSPNHRFIFDMHLTNLHYLDIDHFLGFQPSKIPSQTNVPYKYYIFVISQKSKPRCFYRVSSDLGSVEDIESDSFDQSLTILFFFRRLAFIRFFLWKEDDEIHDDWRIKGAKQKIIKIK